MFENSGKHIMDHLSNAPDAYCTHMVTFLMFNMHVNVLDTLRDEKFRDMRDMPNELMEILEDHVALLKMLEMELEGLSATQYLLHLNATSNYEDLNLQLL